MHSQFLLGQISIRPEVRKLLGREPLDLVARHAVCEHGQITRRQFLLNKEGYNTGGEIRSRYRADPTDKNSPYIEVITRATWNETVVVLEKEHHGIDF
ncbi:hypothetical protein ACFIQG_17975 [Comamonas odontotermitis]|uniref:hypothetical protein n=1 Tax=Comamonas odontotermitis TaxID=379895 RepID=UPI00366B80E6